MAVTRPTNAFPVRPLVSDTAGNALTAAELELQEIGINTADKKLFVKNLAGVLVELDFGSTINDTLTSTSTDESLSAAQGKALKDQLDGFAAPVKTATITTRDALTQAQAPVLAVVHVTDDGDGKWAKYQDLGDGTTRDWEKVADEDALNAGLSSTNLGYTASATNGLVTNSAGSDSTLPLATNTNAGLLPPSTGDAGRLVFATTTGYAVAAPEAAGTF